jgi:hypothetical protein
MDEAERRRWALPVMSGVVDGIDLSLLDPADADERRLLIEAEHPEFRQALALERTAVTVAGREVNPVLHVALHQIVAQQLWEGDPELTWSTARRLTVAGHDRHDVLHMLMFVIGEDVRRALVGEPQRTELEIQRAFTHLPHGWLDQREAPALPRTGRRRAHSRRR